MAEETRARLREWVGTHILPHEGDLRAWLRRTCDAADVEDVVQEAYCQISSLKSFAHIQSGRSYLFTTARNVVLMRLRRARIVRIDAAAELDAFVSDEPSAERVVMGRRELERVRRLIEALPDRCRKIFELRKIEGLSQRRIAAIMEVPEHTVENDLAKGMKFILRAIAEGEREAEQKLTTARQDERSKDSRRDQ